MSAPRQHPLAPTPATKTAVADTFDAIMEPAPVPTGGFQIAIPFPRATANAGDTVTIIFTPPESHTPVAIKGVDKTALIHLSGLASEHFSTHPASNKLTLPLGCQTSPTYTLLKWIDHSYVAGSYLPLPLPLNAFHYNVGLYTTALLLQMAQTITTGIEEALRRRFTSPTLTFSNVVALEGLFACKLFHQGQPLSRGMYGFEGFHELVTTSLAQHHMAGTGTFGSPPMNEHRTLVSVLHRCPSLRRDVIAVCNLAENETPEYPLHKGEPRFELAVIMDNADRDRIATWTMDVSQECLDPKTSDAAVEAWDGVVWKRSDQAL